LAGFDRLEGVRFGVFCLAAATAEISFTALLKQPQQAANKSSVYYAEYSRDYFPWFLLIGYRFRFIVAF
jgi:hypothetical protein